MIKASAIILVYHDEKYLNNCVKSLRESAKLAKVDLQIIVVVNDINLKNLNFSFPKKCTIIFNKENLGFGKSINLAVKKAQGDWLILVNVDTITNKSTLKKLFSYANKKDIGIITPKILNPDGSLQFSILDKPTLWNIFKEQTYLYKLLPFFFHSYQVNKALYNNSHFVENILGAYFIIKKSVYLKVNGFDENYFIYFEDIDLCEKIRKVGSKILFNADTSVLHFDHQSGGGFRVASNHIKSLHYYWIKNYNGKYWKLLAVLLLLGFLLRYIYWIMHTKIITNIKDSKSKILYYKDGLKILTMLILNKS